MRGDSGQPEERVRQALAELGADPASAPEVPAPVTARIGAALRAASPPAHTAAPPRLSRLRIIALVVGIGAAVAAAAVGIAMLTHSGPAPRFPSGPTAEKITVSTSPADTPKPVVKRP
ncbi:hypothetical protein A5662_26240 [Mycobacteriaceae bacterium 1482268.1]|nr:hypothetical protein A5662_26240 [Mycobacteriaceae bacterium 1482268.1]